MNLIAAEHVRETRPRWEAGTDAPTGSGPGGVVDVRDCQLPSGASTGILAREFTTCYDWVIHVSMACVAPHTNAAGFRNQLAFSSAVMAVPQNYPAGSGEVFIKHLDVSHADVVPSDVLIRGHIVEAEQTTVTLGDRVNFAHAVMGLSLTQISQIVGVTRATIYGWLQGSNTSSKRSEAADRLRELQHLGALWHSLGPDLEFRSIVSHQFDDGETLFEMLIENPWDLVQIQTSLTALAKKTLQRRDLFAEYSRRNESTPKEVAQSRLRATVNRGRIYRR